MPGLVVPARRSYSFALDDTDNDDEGETSGTSPAPSRISTGSRHKRARLSDQSEDVENSTLLRPPGNSTVQALNHQKDTRPRRQNGAITATLAERSRKQEQEHRPGSIVRISLKNFVTYTAAAFYPGPSLNMVIGPNGTGKSTLVCAICLGLGWGPALLGRSKDIGEYVKHGYEEATIEIELKGRLNKGNPVIKRTVKREGNHSKWFLDGSATTLKQIQELVHGFSIQIDNLCQFLPQDRVVNFAQLSPVELLASTQRAAAPPYMIDWHEDLKRLRKEQREHERAHASLKQNLSNLESRQATQQADVERMRQRTEVLETIRMLEKCRPRAQWSLTKMKRDELKPKAEAVDADLKALKHQTGPGIQALNSKVKYREKVEKVVRQRQQLLEECQKDVRNTKRDHEDIERKIEECRGNVEAEKSGNKERKSEVARLMNQVKLYKNLLNQEKPDFDPAIYNERIRSKEREIRSLQAEADELRERVRNYSAEGEQKKKKLQDAQANLAKLRTLAGQQERKLESFSKDTASAWAWVQKNRDRFDGPVFGPALVECSVSDPNFANQLETCLQKGDYLGFTCTRRNDFKKLQDQLYNRMSLADITIRVSERPLDAYRSPVPKEDLAQYGLEGYAVDYINGPEEVKAMLCAEARLHATGVTSHELDERQYQTLEASSLNSWVTPSSSYQITRRREYGPDAKSTRVRNVRPANVWSNQAVDASAGHDMRDNLDGWESEIKAMEEKKEECKQQVKNILGQVADLELEKKDILDEKNRQQRELAEYNSLPSKLQTQEEKLAFAYEQEANLQQRLNELNEEQSRLALRNAEVAVDYGKKMEKYSDSHVELITASIARLEASSDVDTLSERNRETLRLIDRKTAELRELKKQMNEMKAEGKKLSKEFERALEQDQAFREYCENMTDEERNRLPDELSAEIEAQKARLELLHEGNPGAIQEFEARADRIESLKVKVAGLESTLASQQDEIRQIRGSWEPELDQLVLKISDAFAASFAKIDCAGAVSIYKDGEDGKDFENWAIHIQVKFREHETMSVLDSHRQSGGERAVSTIFYLMALQSLSRAPFRVVDEINQGMDPRNERKVHERLVDIACGKPDDDDEQITSSQNATRNTGSQYFLITPKLLTGLKYSQGMTVHCITGGEYMPGDHDKLDFKALLEGLRASLNSSGASRREISAPIATTAPGNTAA